MRTTKTAWELAPWMREDFTVIGAEGEGDGDGGDGSDGSGDGDGDGDSDDDDGEDEGEGDGGESDSAKDTAALRKALQEERAARRRLEKEQKTEQRKRERANQSDKEAAAQAKKDAEEAAARVTKLAEGFKRTALDRAIEKVAANLKFKDVDDALKLVDRSLIDVDQDEDEPDKVDIDADSVKRAVKKLADAKKHLIASGTDDDLPSGSQFGNNGTRKKPTKDEELKNKYPSLR